jgi:hypothetical protein
MGDNGTFDAWADTARDLFGQALNIYGTVELAKAQRDATRQQVYDQQTGMYYLPGQRYTTAPAVQQAGMSQGTVLLIGVAVVALVLLVK